MTRLDDDTRLPRAEASVAPEDRARMACRECGATFPRSDVSAPEKGSLVCPDCGSRDVGDIDADADT